MQGAIRMLRDGLTEGSRMYREGELIPPSEQTETLKRLASGESFVGHVWAQWEDEGSGPLASGDLADDIKELVSAGLSKTAIMDRLGASDEVSQRSVGEEFDRMLSEGIIRSESRGRYSVAE